MATPTFLTFKGTADASLGVVVSKAQFVQPEIRSEISESEGVDGAIVTTLGRKPYTESYDITLMPTANIDNVIAWLQGYGVLLRADDAGKYRNAYVLSQIDYDKLKSTKQATVEFFIADPYRYVSSEAVQTIVSSPATIVNSGTAIAYPLLKIVGTGTVEFTISGISVTYEFPSGESEVCLDCKTMDAYYVYPTALRNRSIVMSPVDTIPYLSVGNNTLTLDSGSITSIEVTKRTRYL